MGRFHSLQTNGLPVCFDQAEEVRPANHAIPNQRKLHCISPVESWQRTRIARAGAIAAICFAQIAVCIPAIAEDQAKVIKISAKKYEYTPDEIVLKKGEPVVLQLTSKDRHHGFTISSMKVRADIEPGEVTEVKLQPQETGEFEFHCDVFCGAGHENMSGVIKVQE
jgi:cytochrome c oxidase subunit II